MLEILVRNAHGNLSDKNRDYASRKLGKLDRYFQSATKVELAHTEEKRGHMIEVTVFADGFVLRGEELDKDVASAIDKVADKLESRLRRLKTRLVKRHRKKGQPLPMGLTDTSVPPIDEEDPYLLVSKERHYDIKPMSLEDACLQLELVGHPFFVFQNMETNKVEVLYKLRGGKYGIVTPES